MFDWPIDRVTDRLKVTEKTHREKPEKTPINPTEHTEKTNQRENSAPNRETKPDRCDRVRPPPVARASPTPRACIRPTDENNSHSNGLYGRKYSQKLYRAQKIGVVGKHFFSTKLFFKQYKHGRKVSDGRAKLFLVFFARKINENPLLRLTHPNPPSHHIIH